MHKLVRQSVFNGEKRENSQAQSRNHIERKRSIRRCSQLKKKKENTNPWWPLVDDEPSTGTSYDTLRHGL